MDLTWSQFRRAHKGQLQHEVSELWTQYKDGEYQLESEAPPVDPYADFNDAYNIVYGGKVVSPQELSLSKNALLALQKELSPRAYTANIRDGWTLWLGPTNNALLENHSQNVAFTITRSWWQMFGTGAVRVDVQVFEEQSQVLKVKERFSMQSRLFTRYPLPISEYKFSKNMKDSPL